jgi:hypothetical protein
MDVQWIRTGILMGGRRRRREDSKLEEREVHMYEKFSTTHVSLPYIRATSLYRGIGLLDV